MGESGGALFSGITVGAIFPSFIFLLGLFSTRLAADAENSGSEREFNDLIISLRRIKSDQVQSMHQGFKFSRWGIIPHKCCSKESVKKSKLPPGDQEQQCVDMEVGRDTAWQQMLIQLVQTGSQIQCSETIDLGIKTAKDEDGKPFLKVAWSRILRIVGYLSCLSCVVNCRK
nr:PREDICTED: ADP/ATP translocase 3-like [Equus przewalskii]